MGGQEHYPAFKVRFPWQDVQIAAVVQVSQYGKLQGEQIDPFKKYPESQLEQFEAEEQAEHPVGHVAHYAPSK